MSSEARRICITPSNTPGKWWLKLDGSWRDFEVDDAQVSHIVGVIQAWLVVQAGVSYTDAQADMRKALGIKA